jgi:hypothetical protein
MKNNPLSSQGIMDFYSFFLCLKHKDNDKGQDQQMCLNLKLAWVMEEA